MATLLTTSYQKLAEITSSTYSKLRLYGKYNSQSTSGNESSVTMQLRLCGTSNAGGSFDSGTAKINSSSSTLKNIEYKKGSETNLKTYTFTVTHSSDGKYENKTVTANLTTSSKAGVGGSISTTYSLPTIPRTSGITCTSPNIGEPVTITLDRKSTDFVDTLTYEIGTLTGTIEEKTTEKVLFLPTSDLKEQIYDLIPNDEKITGKIICTTYYEDTVIGTATANFDLYANERECKPDVTATIVDTNETTLALGKLVKYVSKPKITVNATAKYGSTITGYSIDLNDGQVSNLQENTFDSIGSNSIIVNAIDSRGIGNPTTIPLDIVDYVKLIINSVELTRPEDVSNEVILNGSGAWFNGNLNDTTKNDLTISFKYKTSEETKWTNGGLIPPSKEEGNTFTFENLSLGNKYDYNKEYQFKIIATDSLMTTGDEDKTAITVPKGIAIVEIGEDFVNVNGDLTISDTEGNNEINVLEKLNEINTGTLPNIMTLGLTSNKSFTVSTAWSYKEAPLNDLINSTGDKLIFEDGGIKIGAGVSKVKVSASVLMSGVEGTQIAGIMLNGEMKQQVYRDASASTTWETRTISPILMNVKEGDVFKLGYGASKTGTIQFGGEFVTHLTVEVTQRISGSSDSGGGSIDLSNYATKEELKSKANKDDIPTNVSQLENDTGYITGVQSLTNTEIENLINSIVL